MTPALQTGWQALEKKEYQAAEAIFRDHINDPALEVEALSGLAQVALNTGKLEQAQDFAAQAVKKERGTEQLALLGDILGRQGKRRQAQSLLEEALNDAPEEGYLHALLGEQRIRQGQWQEGTEAYVRAMTLDTEGRAFQQLRGVLGELVQAIRARKVPESDALKFLNRLDYTVPNRTPEMTAYFALVRRSISGGEEMSSSPKPRISQAAAPEKPTSTRPQSATPPPAEKPRPDRTHWQKPSSPPSGGPRPEQRSSRNTTSSRVAQPSPPERRRESRPDRSPPQRNHSLSHSGRELGIIDEIRKERSLNESLQDLVAELPAPVWPSSIPSLIDHLPRVGRYGNHEDLQDDVGVSEPPQWPSLLTEALDPTPPLVLSTESLLGNRSTIQTNDFRLTSGDMLVEILLERCLENVIASAQVFQSNAISLMPESIFRLELNTWDSLLDDIPPLERLYEEEVPVNDYLQLCLGSFIGACIVQAFGGIWRYQIPAENSEVLIGDDALQPFALAKQWIDAEDKDDVSLEVIVKQASESVEHSTSMPSPRAYLDPTPGLEGQALATQLAELWTSYRFSLGDGVFAEVASTIDILDKNDRYVLFSISSEWVPLAARGPADSALLNDSKVAMSYMRDTGVFLPLASRKNVAKHLACQFSSLTEHSARHIITFLQKYHRPGWHVLHSDGLADKLKQRFDVPRLCGPRLGDTNQGTSLRVWAHTGNALVLWQIDHFPNAFIPWSLRIIETVHA